MKKTKFALVAFLLVFSLAFISFASAQWCTDVEGWSDDIANFGSKGSICVFYCDASSFTVNDLWRDAFLTDKCTDINTVHEYDCVNNEVHDYDWDCGSSRICQGGRCVTPDPIGECGDNILDEFWEKCDWGQNNGNVCTPTPSQSCEYCSDTCELITLIDHRCGNGNLDVGEECDDGNGVGGDGCSQECKITDYNFECSNLDIVADGVGMDTGSGQINLNVPGEPELGLLYWEIRGNGDKNINLNGNPIGGNLIKDPVLGYGLWSKAYSYIFDFTSYVSSGANVWSLSGLDRLPEKDPAAGVAFVVYEDEEVENIIQIKSINDYSYVGLKTGPLVQSPPVNFEFDSAEENRNTKIIIATGDAEPLPRTDKIWYETGVGVVPSNLINTGTLLDENKLRSAQGPEADVYQTEITIPAGHDYLSVQLESHGTNGDSLIFISTAIAIDCNIPPICGDNEINQVWEQCDEGLNNGNECNINYGETCNYCDLECQNITLTEGFCGDGVLQPIYEQCDDGNLINDDGCDNECQIEPECGNAIVELGEDCDDGNLDETDGCLSDCTYTYCGDNYLQSPNGMGLGGPLDDGYESCDDGANNDLTNSCTNVCTLTFCGDGIIQDPNGLGITEQCDDGNILDGDGCDSGCQEEPDPICGDGEVNQIWEICDDGNLINGDGCDNECQIEPDPICGDEIINQVWEQCEPPTSECTAGYNETCTYCDLGCQNITKTGPYCGDGNKDICIGNCVEDEECDGLDGLIPGYICDEECKLIPGPCEHDVAIRYSYANSVWTGIAIRPEFGGWMLDDPEELEQGQDYVIKYYVDNKIENSTNTIHVVLKIDNITLADYITPINNFHYKNVDWNTINITTGTHMLNLFVEKVNETDCNQTDNYAHREIIILPSNDPICGNEIVEIGEQCDDGNLDETDGCLNDCTYTFCGDGYMQNPNGIGLGGPLDDGDESCDDGANNDLLNSCTDVCTLTFCGDGFIQDPNGQGIVEGCDDGNIIDGDGCDSGCQEEEIITCGDGEVNQIWEQCDLGINNGDTCTAPYDGSCTYCDLECQNITLIDGTCGDGNLDEPWEQCDDGNLINGDGCSSSCQKEICTTDIDCDDGIYCNGQEVCNLNTYECETGTVVECSIFDLPTINICTNDPDLNPFTLDYALGFTSTCNELTQSCTTDSYDFTHTCELSCGAECLVGDSETTECGTDVGECEFGEIVVECTEECLWDESSGECIGEIGPAEEICDGLDNNCNGEIDEFLLEEFERISYSTVDTGNVILINGYSEFVEENVDFFHGYVHQRDGEYLGFGSMHARGTTTTNEKIQINVKFDVTELVEYTCDHITWRNYARGTYWMNGIGTVTVEYDYMDITYWLLTGEIDAVGEGDVDFEFTTMIDRRF